MAMLVNSKSSKLCCKLEFAEYGKSNKGKLKDKFRRQLKKADRRAWKKDQ